MPANPIARAHAKSTPTARWVRRTLHTTTDTAPLLDRILASRGLNDPLLRAGFLNPDLRNLHDPSLLPGVDRAAERLCRALRAGERIAIYGDYDVDGITASAILFLAMRTLVPEARVSTYVPHRIDEGYGLNTEALLSLASQGNRVIVTVDCGITAAGPAAALREAAPQVDLIITDHHTPPTREDAFPQCFALVHPRMPGSKYPFGELCGAAVAYKLAWRMGTLWSGNEKVPPHYRTLLVELLALAGMGVIADIVPLVDENRIIAAHGLRRIRTSPLPGLDALVVQSGLDNGKVLAEDVGFKLGPRLNAVGRLGHAREALELLTIAPPARATEIAAELTRQNDLRRAVERDITAAATEMAIAQGMTEPDCPAIVLRHQDWHPGVVGIVCSRLVERFHRPTILLCDGPEICAGSGRSISGFSLHHGLEACRDHLTTFGGHDMAAGLKLLPGNFDAFQRAFTQHAAGLLAPDDLHPVVNYDCEASIDELSLTLAREIRRLEPFGRDNPAVRLLVRGVTVDGKPQYLGSDAHHLLLHLVCTTTANGSGRIRALAWKKAEWGRGLPTGARLDLILQPKINTWNSRESLEAEIVDLRLSC